VQRWTHFAQVAAAAAYDLLQMGAAGGDMCVPLLRSLTCVFNSAGLPAFAPFLESIVHPAVQRIAAAVATDGESEYFDEDGIWDGFMSNFIEFLENILLFPSAQITDVVIRHDVLSCVMRLLAVRLSTNALGSWSGAFQSGPRFLGRCVRIHRRCLYSSRRVHGSSGGTALTSPRHEVRQLH